MKQAFPRIGLMGKPNSRGTVATLDGLVNLLQARGHTITVDLVTAALLQDFHPTLTCREDIAAESDLVIVVGGDGSLLRAARGAVDHQTPVLGINRGRLGFLTDIYPTELNTKLIDILEGTYREDARALLCVDEPNVKSSHLNLALNDIVLRGDGHTRLMEFEIFIDHQFVCSHRADGIIVATPTGSTAYALSAGGPIIHPSLDTILLIPMFAHTLSSRPIVVDGKSTITIVLARHNGSHGELACDGQLIRNLSPAAIVTLKRYPKLLRLIHANDYNYFEMLRSKLHWGSQR